MTLPFSVDLLRTKVKQTKGKETNTHLSELSQQMKEALISRQQELSTMVVNWERMEEIGLHEHQQRLSQAHSRRCTQTKLSTQSAYTRMENRL